MLSVVFILLIVNVYVSSHGEDDDRAIRPNHD